MNTNKAEQDAQLKITSHLFAGLQLTQSVNAALSQAQIEERFNTIAFADIMRAVLDPEANQETLKYISKNLQARQGFQTILLWIAYWICLHLSPQTFLKNKMP